ncbi:hypothetical protein FACS189421_14460 [Bacteroidia bacterium]|nr:hypothetical protein FACS189421_14460 [Bacteroidia bacterium]
MKIQITDLREKIIAKLKNMNDTDRAVIADYLVWAEMSGIHTQGIIKMAGKEPVQNIIPEHEIKIIRETPVSAVLNAGGNPGISTCARAADIAIDKAKASGIAIVGGRNIFSSNGAQA